MAKADSQSDETEITLGELYGTPWLTYIMTGFVLGIAVLTGHALLLLALINIWYAYYAMTYRQTLIDLLHQTIPAIILPLLVVWIWDYSPKTSNPIVIAWVGAALGLWFYHSIRITFLVEKRLGLSESLNPST